MPDLTQMTQTALKSASKGASKATSKDGALSDPKTLAVAGVGLPAFPLAVEQIAKRGAKGAALSKLTPGSEEGEGLLSKLTPGSGEGEGEGLLSKLKPGSSNE